MKYRIIILFILVTLSSYGQIGTKEFKKVKKLSEKYNFQLFFVFGGAQLDQEIFDSIKNEMILTKDLNMKSKALSIGDDCDYCKELKSYLLAKDADKVYVLERNPKSGYCKPSSAEYFSDLQKMEEGIVTDILSIRDKKYNDVIVFVSGLNSSEYYDLKDAGWSEEIPNSKNQIEEIQSIDCAGEQVTLFREKPCGSISDFYIDWNGHRDLWSVSEYNANVRNVYIHGDEGRPNYYFYSPNICFTDITFKFYSDGDLIWKTSYSMDNVSFNNGQFEFRIYASADSVDYFTKICNYYVDYSVKVTVTDSNGNSRDYDLGLLNFIKCPK
jgi:hypothetical protein